MPWIAPHNTRRDDAYHTDIDCRNIPSEPKQKSHKEVQRMELSECSVCAGEVEYDGENRNPALRDLITTGELEVE